MTLPTPGTPTTKPPRTVIAAGVSYLLALLAMMVVRDYYTWHMPTSPDAASSRTIPVGVNYGKTVYVDTNEQRLLFGTYVAFAVSGIGTVVMYLATRRRRVIPG